MRITVVRGDRSEEIDLERWNDRSLPSRVSQGLTRVARREL